MGGRNRPESVAAFARNGWPLSSGIGGRNRPEYAHLLSLPLLFDCTALSTHLLAIQSSGDDLVETLEEILSYGIGGLYARHVRECNVFWHEPFYVKSHNRPVLRGKLAD